MMVPIEPQQIQIAVNFHLLVLIGSQPISLNQSTEVGIRSHGLSFECQYIGYTDVEAVQPTKVRTTISLEHPLGYTFWGYPFHPPVW